MAFDRCSIKDYLLTYLLSWQKWPRLPDLVYGSVSLENGILPWKRAISAAVD